MKCDRCEEEADLVLDYTQLDRLLCEPCQDITPCTECLERYHFLEEDGMCGACSPIPREVSPC